MTVALVSAPVGFEKTLGELPQNARLKRRATGKPDLVIWFTRSRKDLAARIDGLGAGLVDFKICAIDDTWSGLRFARRKRKP